jgi:hypothetical protein
MSSLCRLLLLCMAVVAVLPAATVASGKGATGITVADGWLDEGRILQRMGQAALGNCFLTSIRVDGIEFCQFGMWPSLCVRMRNNTPSNLLEASGKRQHVAVMTVASEAFLEGWGADQRAQPTNKKIGQDSSSWDSSSGRAQGRTLATPLLAESVMALVQGGFAGTLCNQPSLTVGYHYFAEADEGSHGQTMWRDVISSYYLNRITAGMSLFSKMLETSGLCGLDTNYLLCLGGWGTKYPTSGTVEVGSPPLRLITAMWRAQEIHAQPAGTFGPYETSLGAAIHGQLHLPQAMAGGITSNVPGYSPGSYTQFLYPGPGAPPVGHPDSYCQILGIGAGTSPAIANQMTSEVINDTWTEEDTMALVYWSRWTCCTWCTGSNDHAAKHMIPEQGYSSVLTRKP